VFAGLVAAEDCRPGDRIVQRLDFLSLHLKTDTMDEIFAIAGYVQALDGRRYVTAGHGRFQLS